MENDVKCEDNAPCKDKKESCLQKICLVCGDKALGYNFNAISCESCKAFFRRNALSGKELKCPFTNNCEITIVTRRFCQKCRLEKCLSVGMVKEFIMSEEDKAEKRKKIEENRAKKRHNMGDQSDETVSSSKNFKRDNSPSSYRMHDPGVQYDVLNSTSCSPTGLQSPLAPHEVDTCAQYTQEYQHYVKNYELRSNKDYQRTLTHEYNMECVDGYDDVKAISSIRSILTNGEKPAQWCEPTTTDSNEHITQNKARDILQDVQRIEPNSIESILCEAIKLEFEAYTSVNSCSGSSRELNEVERAKLNELIVANKALHAPIDDDVSQLIGNASDTPGLKCGDGSHDPELITIMNLTAIAIRRLIKMAKKINAFKNMCEEDQVALLKGGCTEMMVLRSTMTYDGQRNSWKLPHSCEQFGSIKTDVLKLAKGNIYQAHESFIRSFEARWRQDEHVILIMSAILLFTPDRPRVVHRDVIKLEQNSYYYLLRRYLESVYPGCEAKSTFLKLIQKILELRKLSTEITGVYLDVNPIEPLLIEIFDLKQHPK